MIQFNVVSRIANDKNWFLDIIFAASKIKQNGLTNFNILFIGAIDDEPIYQNIVRLAHLLEVSDKIAFTKKSVSIATLDDDVKSGYFINFSVGSFLGYSSIESINLGLKTVFLNIDQQLAGESSGYINLCPNIDALVNLILTIAKDQATVDKQISVNNLLMKSAYVLNAEKKALLKSMLIP
jgi:hypothetical protein